MIKIKPELLYIRDPDTKEFTPLLAMKGEKGEKGDTGSIGNIGDYMTSETGDSEKLAMTQKGATDIKEELVQDIADTISGVNDLSGVATGVTYYTICSIDELNEIVECNKNCVVFITQNIQIEDILIPKYSRGWLMSVGYAASLVVVSMSGEIYSAFGSGVGIEYVQWTGVRVSSHADTADKAIAIDGKEATSVARYIWLSDAYIYNQRAYSEKFKYDPETDTLLVGNVNGKAAKTTCISELVEWPSAATTVTDGDKYPPTANAVQARLSDIYFNFVSIESAIQALQNLCTSLDNRVLTLEVKASNA